MYVITKYNYFKVDTIWTQLADRVTFDCNHLSRCNERTRKKAGCIQRGENDGL